MLKNNNLDNAQLGSKSFRKSIKMLKLRSELGLLEWVFKLKLENVKLNFERTPSKLISIVNFCYFAAQTSTAS